MSKEKRRERNKRNKRIDAAEELALFLKQFEKEVWK